MYKFKEKDDIISVINEDDTVVARYTVDYHWQEKNVSVRDGRPYNEYKMKDVHPMKVRRL